MIIKIVDVDIGNVGSVKNMLAKLGYDADLCEFPPVDVAPDLIILPGVGSFDYGMRRLHETGWESYLKTAAAREASRILGICLGMQLLCDGSDEGGLAGLGLVPGRFVRFGSGAGLSKLKVPHMGWNTVRFDRTRATWSANLPSEPRFYFVHSYYYSHATNQYVVGNATYGNDFAAAIQNQGVIGVQFHPEKSHQFGMKLLGAIAGRQAVTQNE